MRIARFFGLVADELFYWGGPVGLLLPALVGGLLLASLFGCAEVNTVRCAHQYCHSGENSGSYTVIDQTGRHVIKVR